MVICMPSLFSAVSALNHKSETREFCGEMVTSFLLLELISKGLVSARYNLKLELQTLDAGSNALRLQTP